MKRNIIRNGIFAAAVCAGVCVAPSGAGEQPGGVTIAAQPAPGRERERMKALEKLLNDYAGENAALKLRVKELEAQLEQLKQSRGVTIVPGPLKPPADRVPPDWKPFRFNGVTYYIIPCDQTPRSGTGSLNIMPGADGKMLRSDRPAGTRGGNGIIRIAPTPKVDERPAK